MATNFRLSDVTLGLHSLINYSPLKCVVMVPDDCKPKDQATQTCTIAAMQNMLQFR